MTERRDKNSLTECFCLDVACQACAGKGERYQESALQPATHRAGVGG